MHHIIYISEPEVIDADTVRTRLADTDSEIIIGNAEYSGDIPADCDTLLIRSTSKVTDAIKLLFPNLKNVIRVGVGLDNVDLPYCKNQHIAVYNAPGANADAVSDYIMAVMLYALRKLHTLEKQDIEDWNRFKFMGRNLSELRVGIVGYGNIGKALYRKLWTFNCPEIYVYDPYISFDTIEDEIIPLPLTQLLKQSDIVSLHLPLNPKTKHLIDHDKLLFMKDNAILINASRGGIVNETDLLVCIDKKRLTYIADTVENEPHVNKRLLENENIIITPHIASLTNASDKNMLLVALSNFLQGNAVTT